MNDQPAPHEDVDDVLQIDPAARARVRMALRDVPPQDVDQARVSIDTALDTLAGRQRRRGAWLIVAAAGIVGVLGVAVLRGSGSPDSDSDVDMVAAPMVADESPTSRLAEPEAASQTTIEQFRLDILGSTPVDEATCPVMGAEQSYGMRPWEGRTVEIVVDTTTGLFRIVDATSCQVLVVAPLTP